MIKTFLYPLILVSISRKSNTASGVEITKTSERQVTVREGESLDLFCDSATPYQWCYWAHNGSEYPTTSHKGGGEIRQATMWGFEWRKSSTRCGLHIANVNPSWSGQWKCHLANTDSQELEKIRAESWISVTVATPAKVMLKVMGSRSKEQEEISVIWGQEVEAECKVMVPGNPAPSLLLSLNNTDQVTRTSSDTASLTYLPSLQESGSRFSCSWVQSGPDGGTLYKGESVSGPLNVVMGPSIIMEMETQYIYEEGLRITPQFMARPVPDPEDIRWYVLTENQTTLDVHEAAEAGLVNLVPGSVRNVARNSNPDEWELDLRIFNLTDNVTVWFHAENSVGFLDKMFTVELPAPISASSDELSMNPAHITDTNDTRLDMTAVSVVGLIALIIFTIILIIVTIIVVRFRNKEDRHKDKGNDLEQYRRVPLIPLDGANLCCDTAASSTKSCSCYSRYQGLSMNTFGKNCENDTGSATGYIYPRSDTIPSLTSPSSVDTDKLSSLGVRLKEFPDPLADWEDLEPGLQQRRSVHVSDSFDALIR